LGIDSAVTPQARVDQLKTAFDVATNELKSARAERQVAEEQVSEGQVLAPAAGRVLKVPVTTGSVVMTGESVATIAANQYLLRLELPERHARFMKTGDPIKIGSGLAEAAGRGERIIRLSGLRWSVLADAVASIGDYFVGERALVWICWRRMTIGSTSITCSIPSTRYRAPRQTTCNRCCCTTRQPRLCRTEGRVSRYWRA
jgi:multidrug resistance efflux pump